jgi:hypothetical protein
MTRNDPRGAARRGASPFGAETGYDIPNDAPAKPAKRLGRKAPQLPHTGCHLYQAPAAPQWFPGTMAVYQRCPKHQPAASVDLGAVPGHCIECDMEPFTVTAERMEY